ncbi:MAG: hypothetical protein VB105_08805 [Paludibacter sp.]|jgi:hypothetical protein|nr:hypothetical protein [Paludibacter sp.]
MKNLIFILLVFLLHSCATLLNNEYTILTVYTDKPTRIKYENFDLAVNEKQGILVKRGPEPLIIEAKQDSLEKTFILSPRLSSTLWFNVYNYGIGLIVDHFSPKKYAYQKEFYLDFKTSNPKPEKFLPQRKGQLYLNYSIPFFNWFSMSPINEGRKQSVGFFGTDLGADYNYKNNKFVSLNYGFLIDFPMPLLLPLEYFYSYESMNAEYYSISDNIRLKNISLGYGLSFNKNDWRYHHIDWFSPDGDVEQSVDYYSREKQQGMLGLNLNIQWRLKKHFHLGLNYRPGIYRLYPNSGFGYEHNASIGLIWKFKILK